MIVLRENEAISYLERLDKTFSPSNLYDNNALILLRSLIKVKLTYLKRLSCFDETRSLVDLPVNLTGFPEMPSLWADAKKVLEALTSIQAKRAKVLLPVLDQIRVGNIADATVAATEVLSSLKAEDWLADDLKDVNVDILRRKKSNLPRLYEDKKFPGVLTYANDITEYGGFKKWGYLKFIDESSNSNAVLINRAIGNFNSSDLEIDDHYNRGEYNYRTHHQSVVYIGNGMETFTDILRFKKGEFDRSAEGIKKILGTLRYLDQGILQDFLAVDFTESPDKFHQLIQTSESLAPYLREIRRAQLSPAKTEKRSFFKFGRRAR